MLGDFAAVAGIGLVRKHEFVLVALLGQYINNAVTAPKLGLQLLLVLLRR